jgi:hypothetical protein
VATDLRFLHNYAIIACMSKLNIGTSTSGSDAIRRHAYEKYVLQARRRKEKLISINVGDVHREMGLSNRVPLVCAALGSKKFLTEHGLRIVSKTGPPSGQSTTVTFLYEMVNPMPNQQAADEVKDGMWNSLRGIGKDVYASYGGGEQYLRRERANFYAPGKDPLGQSSTSERSMSQEPTKQRPTTRKA